MGYLEQDMGNYSVLKLTPKARPLLKGEEPLTLARPRVRTPAAKKAGKRPGSADRNEELFQQLRVLRKRLADEQQVPPFVIFGDVTLSEMAAVHPTDMDGFARITGVGVHKLGRYGEVFLELLRNFPVRSDSGP